MIINTTLLPSKFSTHKTNSKSLSSAPKLYRSPMAPPQVDDEYRKQIQSARQQLDKLISDNKHYAPLMLHLALHDAGIYGFQTVSKDYFIKGGPNGSIKKELDHPFNKGLKTAVDLCEEEVKKIDNNKITYADLYQLAGVAAVEITGVPKIEFVPGREDSTQCPEKGLLPNDKPDESLLKNIANRMGLEDKDMVALFGGLNQWSLPVENPPENPKLKTTDDTQQELKFDNSYFRYLRTKDLDHPLLKRAGFLHWVETYEKDEKAFLKDYAVAHKKVSELGLRKAVAAAKGGSIQTDSSTASASSRNRVRLVQGIGIAVVTTAIILGFFLSRRSK